MNRRVFNAVSAVALSAGLFLAFAPSTGSAAGPEDQVKARQ